MKRTLYLTEFKLTKSNSQSLFDKNQSRNKVFSPSNENTFFLAKNKAFKTSKESILDYMIKEETQLMNLNKCEEFYQALNLEKKKVINENSNNYQKKKDYLSKINKHIEDVRYDLN
jgi:hypothetical protein